MIAAPLITGGGFNAFVCLFDWNAIKQPKKLKISEIQIKIINWTNGMANGEYHCVCVYVNKWIKKLKYRRTKRNGYMDMNSLWTGVVVNDYCLGRQFKLFMTKIDKDMIFYIIISFDPPK